MLPLAPVKMAIDPVMQTYLIPSTTHQPLIVMERLFTSPFAMWTSLALTRAFQAEENGIIEALNKMHDAAVGSGEVPWNCGCDGHAAMDQHCVLPSHLDQIRRRQIRIHSELRDYFKAIEQQLSSWPQESWRSSVDKKSENGGQWIALNCAVQEMTVEDKESGEQSLTFITTAGAPACHAMGFKHSSTSIRQPHARPLTPSLYGPTPVVQFDQTLSQESKPSVARAKAAFELYADKFNRLDKMLRQTMERWMTQPLHAETDERQHVQRQADKSLKDLVWCVNQIMALCNEIISVESSYGYLAAAKAVSDAGTTRDLEAGVKKAMDKINSTYLPGLSVHSRTLFENIATQSNKEREVMQQVLAKHGTYREDHGEAQLMAALSEASDSFVRSLNGLGFAVTRLVSKSVALLEHWTILTDEMTPGAPGDSSFFGSSSEASAFTSALVARKRRDAIFSQALGTLVSGFAWTIHRWFRMRRRPMRTPMPTSPLDSSRSPSTESDMVFSESDLAAQRIEDALFWTSLVRVGFMAQFESLLSSQGDEKGMLEDMRAALTDIRRSVRLTVHRLANDDDPPVFIFGPRSAHIVSIGISPALYASVPEKLRSETIPVFPVLLSQGINEQQVFANLSGDSRNQDRVNEEGMRTLEEFIGGWRRYLKDLASGKINIDVSSRFVQPVFCFPTELVNQVDDLMLELRALVGGESVVDGTSKQYSLSNLWSRSSTGVIQKPSTGADVRPLSVSLPTPLNDAGSEVNVAAPIPLPLPSQNTGSKGKRSKMKNSTTVLLLASHLTRLLAFTNPVSPVACCTSAYYYPEQNDTIQMDMAANEGVGLSFYPCTPIAARFTSCKSAKDRTSMSVTLEQVLMLRYRANISHASSDGASTMDRAPSVLDTLNEALSLDMNQAAPVASHRLRAVERSSVQDRAAHHHAGLHPDYFVKLLLTMRGEEGVRLANVERNLGVGWGMGTTWPRLDMERMREALGRDEVQLDANRKAAGQAARRGAEGKYAFNALQWAVLPVLYRPPMRCIGSLIT